MLSRQSEVIRKVLYVIIIMETSIAVIIPWFLYAVENLEECFG